MKNIITLSVLSALILSCGDLVDDLNQNPNNPTSAPYQYSLTATEVANISLHTGEATRKAGIFAGQYTGIARQHLGYSNYNLLSSDFDSQWNIVYSSVVRNALVTKEAAMAEGVTGVAIGITQTLRAMAIGTAASLWGDVPFDEGGSLDFENPAYENQELVFSKVQGLLDEAIVNFSTGTGRPPASTDIFFNGNPVAWLQVAYTLKARYFLQVRDYTAAYTAAQNGVGSDGTSKDANNLQSPHGTALDNANLNYQFFELASRKNDLITSDFFASLIDSDPASNPIPANYRGHTKTDETARYNYLLQKTAVGVQPNTKTNGFAQIDGVGAMVTYAENLLILAEAGARTNFNTGLGHLNEFRAYMATGGYLSNPTMSNVKYEAYSAADFNSGGIENADGISTDDALLREIMEERYITLFGQVEVFSDTRRTEGEATIRVPVVPNVGATLPQRFLYPQSEIDRNTSTPNPVPGFFERTSVNQ